MPDAIDFATWMRAIQTATSEEPTDAHTTAEWTEKLGCHRHTMERLLRQAKAAGRLECVRVQRETLDGTIRRVSAYRLKVRDE